MTKGRPLKRLLCGELADLVAVLANGCFPLRAAMDESGASYQPVKRFDPIGLIGRRQGSNAGGLAGFHPRLLQGPSKTAAADVGKLDLRVLVGLSEDRPGPAHKGPAVEFGHSSAVHRKGVFD